MAPAKDKRYYANTRDDIVGLIPEDAQRVLDVGCGYGMMGKVLKKRRALEVVGIEREASAVKAAKDNVDKLLIGDVENIKIPFEEGYFDCLVYGDVLEHLKDPWKVLKEHSRYLKKGGICVASIPNIAHYSVIKNLFRDNWEYRSEGLLDETHLRFFTISGIRKMFEGAGFAVEEEKKHLRASKSKKLLNKLLFGRLDHLLTEQYIIKARLG